MDAKFENRTVYTKELLAQAIRERYRIAQKWIRLLYLLMTALFAVFLILLITGKGPVSSIIMMGLFILLGFLVFSKGYLISVNSTYQTVSALNPSGEVLFYFYDDRFELVTSQRKAIFKYSQITHTVSSGVLYIFLFQKTELEFIDKSKFTKGTAEDFETFIKGKISSRIRRR